MVQRIIFNTVVTVCWLFTSKVLHGIVMLLSFRRANVFTLTPAVPNRLLCNSITGLTSDYVSWIMYRWVNRVRNNRQDWERPLKHVLNVFSHCHYAANVCIMVNMLNFVIQRLIAFQLLQEWNMRAHLSGGALLEGLIIFHVTLFPWVAVSDVLQPSATWVAWAALIGFKNHVL